MSSSDEIPTLPPPTENAVLNFIVGMLVTSGMYFTYVALFGVTLRVVSKESKGGAKISALAYLFLVFLVYTMNISSLLSTDSALLLCGLKDQTSFGNCRINAVLTPSSVRRLNVTGATAIIISALADLLSIYRAFVLYQRRWLVVVPSVLMLALAIGLFAWAEALPDLAPAGLTFAVFGLLGGVDLLTSGLIISRLSYYRRSIRDLGKEHQKHYASLMAIFVESSAIVSIPRILNAILQFTTEGETSWSQTFANGTSAIGPLLIILRIALQLAHTGRNPAELGVVHLSNENRHHDSGLNHIVQSVVDYDHKDEPRRSQSTHSATKEHV